MRSSLATRLRSTEPWATATALRRSFERPHETRKSATQWLDDVANANERVAHEARLRLGGLGSADSWMAAQLTTAVDVGDPVRRLWSIIGLSCLARSNALGPEAQGICWRLISVARSDPGFGNRRAALTALGRFSAHADVIVPAIVDVVRGEREAVVRAEGIRALRALGDAAAAAAGFLVSALDDVDEAVARHASIALKFVPATERDDVRAIVAAATAHRDPDVRSQLETAIRLQGYEGARWQ